MNILLINHYAGSTRHGMAFRPYYLAREWVRAGHKVAIIAASFSHLRTVQPEFKGRFFDENIEGIDYRWYTAPAYKGNGIGRVRNMLTFLWNIYCDSRRLALYFSPDVVISSSTYPMDIWPARRIAKISNAKLVFEVHDLWPLSPMELGGMSKWHPFIILTQAAEDYAYKHADKVISMLPKALDYMESRGMVRNKFTYIPNGVLEEEWNDPTPLSLDVQAHLVDLRSKGLPVVGYAGTHGLSNALDVLLDAARLLVGKANIVLVGSGPEREKLMGRVAQEGLSNVSMLPAIPKRSIPSFLTFIDIAYIGWHPNPLYRFGISPNKLMDYMMAGRPVLHSVKAGNDPVAEAGCGFTVSPGDATAVSEAVLRLSSMSPDERTKMGQAGREFILKNQTYVVLADKFIKAISA